MKREEGWTGAMGELVTFIQTVKIRAMQREHRMKRNERQGSIISTRKCKCKFKRCNMKTGEMCAYKRIVHRIH